jgi:POT family proton-dependent oligopeptide transporter
MGIWFLATSLGNYMAGRAVGLTQSLSMGSFFLWMAIIPAVIGVILFILARPVGRLLATPQAEAAEGP